jgi:hypothetical protein
MAEFTRTGDEKPRRRRYGRAPLSNSAFKAALKVRPPILHPHLPPSGRPLARAVRGGELLEDDALDAELAARSQRSGASSSADDGLG